MPNSLAIFRLPITYGVDLLSARLDMGDLRQQIRSRMEHHVQYVWEPSSTNRALWSLRFSSYFSRVLDALTGTANDFWGMEFGKEERDVPEFQSIFGARISGWSYLPDRNPALDYIYPLRYNLCTDIVAITRALEIVTEGDIEENIRAVLESYEKEHASSVRSWMKEHMVAHVMPNVHQFYREARESEEMTIHFLH